MRRVVLVAGILVDLLGTIWLLQGLNILGGSRMTGDPFWAMVGVALIIVGSVIVVLSVLRGARRPNP